MEHKLTYKGIDILFNYTNTAVGWQAELNGEHFGMTTRVKKGNEFKSIMMVVQNTMETIDDKLKGMGE